MKLGGVKKASDEKALRLVFWVTSGLIVLIMIVIVVVAANRDKWLHEENTETIEWYDETAKTYDEYSQKITQKIIDLDVENNGEAIKKIYTAYIEKVEDPTVKAMLEDDYYLIVMAYDYNFSKKKEVIEALTVLDEQLKTVESAVALVNAGNYYGNTELVTRYEEIMKERNDESDE